MNKVSNIVLRMINDYEDNIDKLIEDNMCYTICYDINKLLSLKVEENEQDEIYIRIERHKTKKGDEIKWNIQI